MENTNIYPAIPSKNDSFIDDNGKTKKVTLMKLCCNNWTEWKKFFKNLLIGCGHEEIFNEKWCLEHLNKKIFSRSWLWRLRYSTVLMFVGGPETYCCGF